MQIPGLNPSSLNPPALLAADAAAQEKLPWVLIELQAYVAKRENGTTAISQTCDGKHIQVTFCPRRPPHVSYLCVHSPDAAEIDFEPTILATEEEFILFKVALGLKGQETEKVDYYIYQPYGAEGPSLTLLPRPPSGYFFNATNIGILSYSTGHDNDDDDQCGFSLHPHSPYNDKAYIVAGLHRAYWGQPPGQFTLCIYEKGGVWETHTVSLSQQDQEQHGGNEFTHRNCKVIMIGGDAGTMAFVDLWRGIIFCDVLAAKGKTTIPPLSYVKLPEPLQRNKTLEGDSRLYRNIAVVGNRLKYVELQVHYKASVVFKDQFVRNGWMAATWSRPASSISSEGWHEHNKVMDSKDLKVDTDLYFKHLPKVHNDEGDILRPFLRFDVCQPVLGLDDGTDIIYFTAKRNRGDTDGWVVSVDLENKELLEVAFFGSQRYLGINFAYLHSRISMHLESAPGTQGT